MNDKQRVLDFLQSRHLAVISTVDTNGSPQGAVIGFGQTNDLEMIFGTFSSSRKYANLQKNSHVALTIGWDDSVTVQYEGTAREINKDEWPKYAEQLFAKNSESEKYRDHPEERIFVVKPQWIRYSDLAQEPWEVVEITF